MPDVELVGVLAPNPVSALAEEVPKEKTVLVVVPAPPLASDSNVVEADKPPATSAPVPDLRRGRWLLACYFTCFVTVGLSVAIVGPTLTDLGIQSNASVGALSTIFAVRAFCAAVGATVAGVLADKKPHWTHRTITICLMTGAVAMAFVPQCPSVPAFLVVFGIYGLTQGAVGNVMQLQILRVFGDLSPPYMQSLHLSFGVGAMIAPLLAQPFITDDEHAKSTSVSTAYYLCAGIHFATALWCVLYIFCPAFMPSFVRTSEKDPLQAAAATAVDGSSTEAAAVPALLHQDSSRDFRITSGPFSKCRPLSFRVTLVVIGAIMLGFYVGMESTTGGFLYTYATTYIGLDASISAYITSLFWGCFAFGRFSAIFISAYVSPPTMLNADFAICAVGLVLLYASPHSTTFLWTAVGLWGFGMASIYPSAINLCEHTVQLSGKLLTIMLIGDTSGDMIIPLVTGNLINQFGPRVLVYSLTFSCGTCILFYLVFWKLSKRQARSPPPPLIAGAPP